MQGVSLDSTYLVFELRLVRHRLQQLIEGGAMALPEDLEPVFRLVNNALEVIEDGQAVLDAAAQREPESSS